MENLENKSPVPVRPPLRPYKRRVRNILIHKPMQREFTFVIITLLMVSTVAIGYVIHATIHDAAFGGGFHFGQVNPYEVLSEVSYQLILRVSIILFITLIVLGTFGIFFLHRVAGPVHRFRQILLKINEGERVPGPIRFREGDYFKEIAEEMNRLLKRHEFEREKMRIISQKLEEILSSPVPEPPAKALEELKKISSEDVPS